MLTNLLQPKLIYLGDKVSLHSVEMLGYAYILAAIKCKVQTTKQDDKRHHNI